MHKTLNIAVIERLAAEGHLSSRQAHDLESSQPASKTGNLKSLLAIGVVPEQAFAAAVSSLQGVSLIPAEQFPKTAVAGTETLIGFLQEHEALPIVRHGELMRVAMTDPSDGFIVKVLQAKLACKIEPLIAVRSELLSALDRLYLPASSGASGQPDSTNRSDVPEDLENDSALVRDLHRLIQRAVISGASDIHFEPVNQSLRVRFRVTGMLREVYSFPAEKAAQVVARIKLMARLDVTERRHAQNGRFKFPADGRLMDLRVSTLPLHDGESLVLRLLEFTLSQSTLSELGFSSDVASAVEQAISSQQGMILITGPTGSGKSTTLYSLLNRLNRPELKLISIEDPVELDIAGISQIQVDEEHGVSFSQALKSVLRQDPDVIMIGEIRDSETARLAAQAALTGHLVLSTLHTASAPAAVTRMQNLGLPSYLIAATLKAVLAQRLVRRLCSECANKVPDAAAVAGRCPKCDGSGYHGRTTIAEYLPLISRPDQNLGADCFDSPQMETMLAKRILNDIRLADDAKRLISAGLTNDAEIFRVLGVAATVP